MTSPKSDDFQVKLRHDRKHLARSEVPDSNEHVSLSQHVITCRSKKVLWCRFLKPTLKEITVAQTIRNILLRLLINTYTYATELLYNATLQ
jgi:hypothetical protein